MIAEPAPLPEINDGWQRAQAVGSITILPALWFARIPKSLCLAESSRFCRKRYYRPACAPPQGTRNRLFVKKLRILVERQNTGQRGLV
jgi:hypothetical protein